MATIYPFRALRPQPELAAKLASVPYDVVDRDEARELARGNPHSFLHVTKPEIDLADGVDPYSDQVYAQGAQAFASLLANGTLVQDDKPCLYAYELTMGSHRQTGVVLCASVTEYEQNIVRRHEYTRPDKETDRVRHMEALGVQSGKVFLVHRDSDAITIELEQTTQHAPLYDFAAPDGVHHRLWIIQDEAAIGSIVEAFAKLGVLYIADGHHRSAAAARNAQAQREKHGPQPNAEYERFLAVSFPASELQILPYNRVVRSLGGESPAAFLHEVRARFDVRLGKPEHPRSHQFGMFLAGSWYTLTVRAGTWDDADPVARLDVSLLQQQLLEPMLGIVDPRRDKRIDFVGGIRGDAELEHRVASGWAAAFKMHPTAIDDLFAIADAGLVMPPKSTWFEPKLRDGLAIHRF